MSTTTKLDRDLFPAFILDIGENFFERDTDGDNTDGIGILFVEDFTNSTDRFGDMEGDVLAVDLDVLADVVGTDILDGF